MLERILRFSIEHRLLVVLLTIAAAGAWGVFPAAPADRRRARHHQQPGADQHRSRRRCRRSRSRSRSPSRSKRRWRASPGCEYTRSLSRNGFSQVTAVFDDDVDIYFARQQVNERLGEARESLPPGRRADDGADLDRPRRGLHVDGRVRAPARQGRAASRRRSRAGRATART